MNDYRISSEFFIEQQLLFHISYSIYNQYPVHMIAARYQDIREITPRRNKEGKLSDEPKKGISKQIAFGNEFPYKHI